MSTQTQVRKASNAMIRNPISKVKDEHDLRHEDILLDTKLGQGHFGDVHKATFKNKPVAVKTCKATVDTATRRKFLSEAYILKNYNHPNIVKLIGVATDRHPIYIVMELVQGGDLLKLLRDDSKTLSVPERIKMSEDAASGMAYLEGKSCIHRDLAARNCLVGTKNILKISDFGMSREEEEYQIDSNNMRQIPIKWMAPEAMNYGYRMNQPPECPDAVWEWIQACWRKEPEDRPNFSEIKTAMKKIHKIFK
ncbi:tyrosine-protein kinase Fer-like isoform X2 [Apostichopus japonicus]|uniref:tyrosine-protein kinase Fer-like isoform X2 n=1 Tax=Stichopus japonicus TaxID=307972 RepID=UPI003AB6DA73